MERVVLRRIVIPVTTAIVVMFLLHFKLNWNGTFLSLGTNLITLLISVLYVDVVIRRAKAAEEIPADERVRRRLQVFINGSVTTCRIALGYGPDIMDSRKMQTRDEDVMHAEMVRVAREVIEPTVHNRIMRLDQKNWAVLAENMRSISAHADTILSTLGNRMPPNVFAAVIDAQNEANGIWGLHATWPDILGVPDDALALKRHGESSVPHKQALTELAANSMCKLSKSLRILSDQGQLAQRRAPAA